MFVCNRGCPIKLRRALMKEDKPILFANVPTLESGIDVAPGKFDKKNKHSPLKCANLCSKI